jgi:hypothetical protein
VQNKESIGISPLTVYQESYINAQLEILGGKEMPFSQEEYFTNTNQIIEYLSQ